MAVEPFGDIQALLVRGKIAAENTAAPYFGGVRARAIGQRLHILNFACVYLKGVTTRPYLAPK